MGYAIVVLLAYAVYGALWLSVMIVGATLVLIALIALAIWTVLSWSATRLRRYVSRTAEPPSGGSV